MMNELKQRHVPRKRDLGFERTKWPSAASACCRAVPNNPFAPAKTTVCRPFFFKFAIKSARFARRFAKISSAEGPVSSGAIFSTNRRKLDEFRAGLIVVSEPKTDLQLKGPRTESATTFRRGRRIKLVFLAFRYKIK